MKKIIIFVAIICCVVSCVVVALKFFACDNKKQDFQYAFESSVYHPAMMKVKVTGNLTFSFLKEDDEKAYSKDPSYIREQEEFLSLGTFSKEAQQILLEVLVNSPERQIRSSVDYAIEYIISSHDPLYILSKKQDIQKEVLDVLKLSFNNFAKIKDLSLKITWPEPNNSFAIHERAMENYQKALENAQKSEREYNLALEQQQAQQQAQQASSK